MLRMPLGTGGLHRLRFERTGEFLDLQRVKAQKFAGPLPRSGRNVLAISITPTAYGCSVEQDTAGSGTTRARAAATLSAISERRGGPQTLRRHSGRSSRTGGYGLMVDARGSFEGSKSEARVMFVVDPGSSIDGSKSEPRVMFVDRAAMTVGPE